MGAEWQASLDKTGPMLRRVEFVTSVARPALNYHAVAVARAILGYHRRDGALGAGGDDRKQASGRRSRAGLPPAPDPVAALPDDFAAWEEVAAELPKLLAQHGARACARRDAAPRRRARSRDGPELRRAMLLLSYFGHAYVWQGPEVSARLPRSIAVPWHAVARRLGRPPVLSYASYALDNWRRLDPAGPIALGNIALLQNFLGGIDEEWFILVHVEIEARAAPALDAIPRAQRAVAAGDLERLTVELRADRRVARGDGRGAGAHARRLRSLHLLPARAAVHPRLEGPSAARSRRGLRRRRRVSRRGPALPRRDRRAERDRARARRVARRRARRRSAAPLPARDARLHDARAARVPRPPSSAGPRCASCCALAGGDGAPAAAEAVELYDRSVTALAAFRGQHLDYADRYIHRQASTGPGNPTTRGTGGTPFMAYLRKHLDETLAHRIGV